MNIFSGHPSSISHILQLCVDLGNGIASLIFDIPSKVCKYLSKPIPNPPCGADPYLRRSKYLKNKIWTILSKIHHHFRIGFATNHHEIFAKRNTF